MFADPDTGGPLDKAAILRRYRRALKTTKLDASHRFHDLRHTFGTRMAGAGTPPFLAGRIYIMGHLCARTRSTAWCWL